MNLEIWIGIILCLMHSALFSGLNLGFFGLSRLRLDVQAESGNKDAKRILSLRRDAHLLLATLLWGNVASNVLLALLSDSVLSGVIAFFFSTFLITFFGEIFPQAYLSKHALRTSAVLVPVVKFYQTMLYPIAKPTGLLLDKWLGEEQAMYFKENEMHIILEHHARSTKSDLESTEAQGAMNFLALDDILVKDEGEVINPESTIEIKTVEGRPVFPKFNREPDDPFLQDVQDSNEKWVICLDETGEPKLVLNADQFLRDAVYEKELRSIYTYCHRPIVVKDPNAKMGDVIKRFKVRAENSEDDVVDNDIVLYWADEKRIITGADILGRLLRGIVSRIDKGLS